MIEFRTLGTLRLEDSHGKEILSVLTQHKRLALLAYLAVARPRGFHRRDALLGLLWPELDAGRGRDALNQAVYFLRQSLGQDVVVSRGREEVGIDPERLWCDVAAFEAALESGRDEAAIDLYGGDLLHGFFLSDVLEWEWWLESERSGLRGRAAAAAWNLVETSGARNNVADVARWGRRVLDLAPTDESRLAALVTLLDGLGDRAAALRIYEGVEERMRRNYEIEPSPDILAVIHRIRTRRDAHLDVSADIPGSHESEMRAGPAEDPSPVPSAGAAASADAPAPFLAGNGITRGTSASPADGTDTVSHSIAAGSSGASRVGDSSAPASTRRRRRALASGSMLLLGALAAGILAWPTGSSEPATGRSEPATGRSEAATGRSEPATGRSEAANGRSEPANGRSEAEEEYLKGRHFLSKVDGESFAEARRHFERALDLDPTHARAWSGLSTAFTQLAGMMVFDPAEAYPRARAAAERALELSPDLGEAHGALGVALATYYWNTEQAERHFRRALALEPASARIRRSYAVFLRCLGRFDEALREVRIARELDPLFAWGHIEEGITLYMARRHEEALERFEIYLGLYEEHVHVHMFVALVRLQMGDYERALEALRLSDPNDDSPDAMAIRGFVYAKMGRTDEALQTRDRIDGLQKERRPHSPFHMAVVHTALGEHDRALDLLEQAAEQPTWQLRLLKVEPLFDALHSEPRFEALLIRFGLK